MDIFYQNISLQIFEFYTIIQILIIIKLHLKTQTNIIHYFINIIIAKI